MGIAEILTELEQLQSRAAKGTWRNSGLHIYTGQLTGVGSMCTDSTAEYVASLQNHTPALIAEVRRLQADNKNLRQAGRAVVDAIDNHRGMWSTDLEMDDLRKAVKEQGK
jgi:hypothetical protein